MAFDFVRHLLIRRVPQILGLYLGASWIIVEFVSLLVDRFALSPHLIEFCLVVLGAMIPTVVLLAYVHGRPGRNDWTAVEKIAIPANVLGAALLVGFVFADRPLGAATHTVLLEDEEGRTVERVIPKGEFRKKIVLFNFENESGDASLDWLQSGLSFGLVFDLYQDLYVDLSEIGSMQERLNRAGYPEGVGLPVSLQANLAEELHRDYFVNGSFTRNDDELNVAVSLYETRRRRLISEKTYKGDNTLRVIDEVSEGLRRDLGIPERHIEQTTDLRVADVLTHSRDSFRLQAQAFRAIEVEGDWDSATSYLEEAVAADPTAALAQFYLSAAYLLSNRKEDADRAAASGMENIYRLPDRMQFALKYYYYDGIEADPEKRFAVARMMVDLFPDDIEGHVQLAREYEIRNQPDAQIAEYERILDLDPSQYDYLRWIGNVHTGRGEFDLALEYFQRYAQAVPNDQSAFASLGALYSEMGAFEQSKSYYERALIIDPGNVSLMNQLATVMFNLGSFKEAVSQHEEALGAARTSSERARAYYQLAFHSELTGRLAKAIEYKELEWAEREQLEPRSVVIAGSKLFSLGLYAQAGRADEAFEIIRQAERELAAPFSREIPVGYLELYLALEDVANAEAALADVEALVERTEAESYRHRLLAARGRIQELRGQYNEARKSYQEALELAPTGITRHRAIARCYRHLGRLDLAEASLRKNLQRTPYNPRTHYEMALVYDAMGDRDRALEHLVTALEVWSDADPEFTPALEARAKRAEWELASVSTS
jgi:tetratricopeptide (TPR) repeat protein